MKIAVASGKGGTGKTTVSVALALSADKPVVYLDCDVEEPNGKFFLHPEIDATETVSVLVPTINRQFCNGCGDCGDICEFNAIVSQGQYAIVFPELCHSCGGCMYACKRGAITEKPHPIGKLIRGHSGNVKYVEGILDIGVAMAPPLINAVKKSVSQEEFLIIDSPPGTSCSMVSTVRDADFVLLVTEPTPFGLHDLKIAVKTVEELERPFAVIINRFDQIDNCVDTFCQQQGIAVFLRIPEDRKVAEAYSRGQPLFAALPELKSEFTEMLSSIKLGLLAGENA